MVRWRKTSQDSRNTIGFWPSPPAFGAVGWVRARIQRPHGVRPTIGCHVRTVDVTSSPSASGTVLFQLHEGTRACILDRTPGWTEVELDNGNVGWIPEAATEDV